MQVQREGQGRRARPPVASEDLLVVKGFRAHLAALADPSVLDLLYLADIKPVANPDVREAFKVRRSGAYKRLTALKELGLLEERNRVYRTSEYAARLIGAASQLFRGTIKGFPYNSTSAEASSSPLSTLDKMRVVELCRLVAETADYLYNRGAIKEEEKDRRQKLASQVRAELHAGTT